MVDATLFIGTIIIALTEVIKYFAPKVVGVWSIIVAALVGGLVGVVDQAIGVTNVSPAQGILIGLSAAGVVAVAKKVNTGTPTPSQ